MSRVFVRMMAFYPPISNNKYRFQHINYIICNISQQIIMWSKSIRRVVWCLFAVLMLDPILNYHFWSRDGKCFWGYRNEPFGHHTNCSMIMFTSLLYIYINTNKHAVCVTCVLFILMFRHAQVYGSVLIYHSCIAHIELESNPFLAFSIPCPFPHRRNGCRCRLFRSPPMSGTISTPAMLGLKDSINWSNAYLPKNAETFQKMAVKGCLQIGFKKCCSLEYLV